MRKRSFIYLLVLVMFVLASCTPAATPVANTPAADTPTDAPATVSTQPPAAPTSDYVEAPMLQELVKAGSLPPLAERLPEDVFVVSAGTYLTTEQLPNWEPGIYGGTLRAAHGVANWAPDIFVAMNEPLLQAPKIGVQNIVGNIVKDFLVENNNQDFTFYMRKGLKWSDGEPVTMEDVTFTWENITKDEKLNPIFPAWARVGYAANGAPGELTVIDDYTFKISFPAPNGGFLRNLTIEGWKGYTIIINPAHYLKQYHIEYTTLEALDKDLKELNLTNEWWQVFSNKRCQNWDMTNPRCVDYPGLYPWIPKASGNPSVLTWERNPYYFKVDTKGQQLPYIDKIVSTQQDNVEMVNLKVMTGEVDFLRESTALVKMPLYKQNEEQAGFRIALMEMHVDSSNIMLNQTFPDENWQAVARDLRFRQALSLAMNRQEMVDNVYYGFASVSSETVDPEYAAFDVEKANALLDDMGLTEKDDEGMRLYPDGSRMEILLENGQQAPDLASIAELVASNASKAGIRITVKPIDSTLHGTKNGANELQMWVMWTHDIGWDNDITDPGRAGRLWGDWITNNGAAGEEPPDWVMGAVDINTRRWKAVSGSDEYNQIVEEGFQWTRDNLPYINLVEHVKYPMVVNAKLGNVPPSGAPAYAIGANFSIVQMFFKP